jgi:hypothetical protein
MEELRSSEAKDCEAKALQRARERKKGPGTGAAPCTTSDEYQNFRSPALVAMRIFQ